MEFGGYGGFSLTQRGSDSQGLKLSNAVPTLRVETSNTNTVDIAAVRSLEFFGFHSLWKKDKQQETKYMGAKLACILTHQSRVPSIWGGNFIHS